MKKFGLCSALALCALLVGSDAWAVAWTLPNNVKVVETSGSGTNTYSTIQAALAAITTASATNRYLIKVMPGTYTATSGSQIVMKPYVDIEGSGQENTIVTSTLGLDATLWDFPGVTKATIEIPVYTPSPTPTAPIMRLKNLRVQNTSTAGGIALLIKSPWVAVEDVTAVASTSASDCVFDHWYCGISINGTAAANVELQGVTALGSRTTVCANDGEAYGIIAINGSSVTIENSKSKGIGTTYGNAVQNTNGYGYESANVVIRGSVLEAATTANGGAVGIHGSPTAVINSKALVHDCDSCIPIEGVTTVIGSETEIGLNCVSSTGIWGADKVATTKIDHGFAYVGKIVNCWDENFDPIPNQ
jgi:pectin methylesterase-like acyl-CoA thioesterase